MLEVTRLTRYFLDREGKEFAAVNDVNFHARPGEILGLLGPNGAGKTTTLRMVAAILQPSAGTITLNGQPLDASSADTRRQLGFLSASTGLYERLTAREILTYFARLNQYPKERLKSRVDEIMKAFQIEQFADTRCEKLSTGMRQRVSIARSVVHDPSLIILDEPTSGLDVIAKQSIYEFIHTCKQANKTILFSTHLMNEAEKLCDRIGILHRGKMFEIGTLDELRQRTSLHYLEDIFLSVVREDVVEVF
jgi:sodium transport system ATP-binding protein